MASVFTSDFSAAPSSDPLSIEASAVTVLSPLDLPVCAPSVVAELSTVAVFSVAVLSSAVVSSVALMLISA